MAVETKLAKETVVQVAPGISAAYGAWGREVTNKELEAMCTDKERPLIAATRFTLRHLPFRPTPFLENREEIDRDMSEVGVRLGRQALEANGWDKAEHLYVATSTAPDEIRKWAEKIAYLLDIEDMRLSCLACNGGGAAIFDSCREPELANDRVLILAVEALGYFANPKTAADLAIFGNGGGAIAYRPRQIHVFNGKTVIVRDEKGVIRPPKTYDLPPAGERIKPPEWYEVRDGGEEVFACSKKGVFMSLPQPEAGNPYMRMDGEETAKFFKYLVLGVQQEVLEEYYGSHTEPVEICISHQPSGVINRHNARGLWRWLKDEGLPIIDQNTGIPWVMDKVGMGNASSATVLIALATLAPALKPQQRFLFTSFGVGASVTAFVGEIIQ